MTLANADHHYMLATGNSDRERLDILADIYDAPSHAFLHEIITEDTTSVLDIGCGHGTMTRWFAQRLAPNSQVIGLDSSAEQLALCKSYSQHGRSKEILFWNANIAAPRHWERSFDLIYSRFVLLHIADWQTFFDNVRSLCRPGGEIVLEEPSFPFFAYPDNPKLNRANELGLLLTKMKGLRFDCAPPLWEHLQMPGLEICQVQFHQPALVTPKQKKIIYLSFIQIRQSLLAAGLASANETAGIASEMLAMANNPHCVIGGLRMMQVHLRNNPHISPRIKP